MRTETAQAERTGRIIALDARQHGGARQGVACEKSRAHGGARIYIIAMRTLGLVGFLQRFMASLLLVFATYNPTPYSFVHWLAASFPRIEPLQLVVGIALLGLWLFFLHSTWRSLGTLGIALGAAFFAAVIWLFSSWGWFNVANHAAVTWLGLSMLASLLAVGLSWAIIRNRVSGQATVDEVSR